MIQIAQLLKEFFSSLTQGYIPDENISTLLKQKSVINKIKDINYEHIKTKYFTSPLSVFLYLISFFCCLSLMLLILQLTFFGITFATPFFNDDLNDKIKNLDIDKKTMGIINICLMFFGFKILKGFISVLHDIIMQFLAVRMYTLMVETIIKYCKGFIGDNGNLLTIVQDDCENIINLPSGLLITFLKGIEFITFVVYLLSLIKTNRFLVLSLYATFFILNMLIAYKYYTINSILLRNKKQRLTIVEKSDEQIQYYRKQQLYQIKILMIVQGFGNNLPNLINVVAMLIIYGMDDIDENSKYTVLIIFGMITSSTFGLSIYANLLAKNVNSSVRIINQLNEDAGEAQKLKQRSENNEMDEHTSKKQSKINYRIIFEALETGPILFRPIFIVLLVICTVTYYSYGYFADSVSKDPSLIADPFNLIILISQFLVPTIFYIFLCFYGLKISKMIYIKLLKNPQRFRNLNNESLNRLSGDIRMIDRSFFISLSNNFTGLSRFIGSLVFSIFSLNDLILSILFTVVFFMVLWLFKVMLKRMMVTRRNIYRRQARSKGFLINDLKNHQDSQKSLVKIHEMKQIGFLIEEVFFLLVYAVTGVLVTIFLAVLLSLGQKVDNLPILVMILIQLDSNLIQICINWIHYEICLTSTERCLGMLKQFQQNEEFNCTKTELNENQESLLSSQ